jgi:hypothetical protein
MTIGYLEKASCVKDSEVKAWIKNDNVHMTPIKLGSSTVNEKGDEELGVLRKRAQRPASAQKNNSEEGIMLSEIQSSNYSISETTRQSADLAGVSGPPSASATGDTLSHSGAHNDHVPLRENSVSSRR